MTDIKKEPRDNVCGLPCLVYSRVVGYISPVQVWNPGKKAEYFRRKVFDPTLGTPKVELHPELVGDVNAVMQKRYEGTPGW